MESIIQHEKVCYVCGARRGLHRHHVLYGTANRRLSEEDGLTVWLCAEHHTGGKEAVHNNPNKGIDLALKQTAQISWEQVYYSNRVGEEEAHEAFRRRYGKNYL